MKRPAPVSAGSHLACVVGRPTLGGVCNLAVDGATGRGEPTVMSSMASAGLIHLGMDTSMNTIVVGVLRLGEETPVVERVFNDEESIRRLIGRFADRRMNRPGFHRGSDPMKGLSHARTEEISGGIA
jgi:hypothetical protein